MIKVFIFLVCMKVIKLLISFFESNDEWKFNMTLVYPSSTNILWIYEGKYFVRLII